jgi:probable F420-dependent oxidoreductase
MRLGSLLPLDEVGGSPGAVRDHVLAVEAMGYDFVEAPDHVLGTDGELIHDPFVLFGYLSGVTTRIGFSTGVLILPQRQTALVAKQAASVDVLSGGRFRLGVGVGWNELEYTGLGQDFHDRGARSEEQAEVLRRLWAEPAVDFAGRWHRIPEAGISPRPASGRVPLWFGGGHERTLHRVARFGDGWIPNTYPPGQEALDVLDRLRALVVEAGRDPASVGVEVWTSMGAGAEEDWRAEAAFWRDAGATHLCVTTAFEWMHHRRIAGRTAQDHLAALRRYRDAVADLL